VKNTEFESAVQSNLYDANTKVRAHFKFDFKVLLARIAFMRGLDSFQTFCTYWIR